jgi:hypothetical protein
MRCRRRTDEDYNCTAVEQSELKRQLGRPEHRWKDNMIIYRLILNKEDLRGWNEDWSILRCDAVQPDRQPVACVF